MCNSHSSGGDLVRVSVSAWIVGQTGRLQVSRKAGLEFEITLQDQRYDLENLYVN